MGEDEGDSDDIEEEVQEDNGYESVDEQDGEDTAEMPFQPPESYSNLREAMRYLLWLVYDMWRRGEISLDQKLELKMMIIHNDPQLFDLAARCQHTPYMLRQALFDLIL